jgi:SOS-response transcriptional repressor LexA
MWRVNVETKTERRPLSAKQRTVLVALVRFIEQHHRQPSMRELAKLVGTANIQNYFSELEARGYIKRTGMMKAVEFATGVFEEITGAAAPHTGKDEAP